MERKAVAKPDTSLLGCQGFNRWQGSSERRGVSRRAPAELLKARRAHAVRPHFPKSLFSSASVKLRFVSAPVSAVIFFAIIPFTGARILKCVAPFTGKNCTLEFFDPLAIVCSALRLPSLVPSNTNVGFWMELSQ